MKKAALALIILTVIILIARPISAQAEKCSLGAVEIVNDVNGNAEAHSKVTWRFSCSNSTVNYGQLTKIVYSIPLTDVANLETTDSFGSMKVLEGPAYGTATLSGKQTTIGVIFRKAIMITNEQASSFVTVDFDSAALVSKGENSTFSISPAKQVANPKVTILTAGITETTYPIGKFNYELGLPSDASVQTISAGCSLRTGRVLCQNINQTEFNSIEIRWTMAGEGGGIMERFRQITGKLLPSVTNIFKGISNSLSKVIKGK